MLLKKVFNALNSLSMCIFSSHSSNPRLTSYETLILNNHFVWMKNGSYGWAYALVGPWFNSSNLCRTFHVLNASLLCIYLSCIFVYAFFFLILICCICFVWVKIQNHIKSEKFKKFDRICLSTFHMWVWLSTFVLMA